MPAVADTLQGVPVIDAGGFLSPVSPTTSTRWYSCDSTARQLNFCPSAAPPPGEPAAAALSECDRPSQGRISILGLLPAGQPRHAAAAAGRALQSHAKVICQIASMHAFPWMGVDGRCV